MAGPELVVVRTGVANLASVLAGLRRAGGNPVPFVDPRAVRDAKRLVLPGVGSFASGMQALHEQRLVEPLVERLRAGRPTLAICLGLQLLADGSDESPGVAGLGILDGRATRIDTVVRVPHLGWNSVEPEGGLIEPGHAYFAHSYRLCNRPHGWRAAWADHGGRFVAAVERGAVLACQFHPELSGKWGIDLLRRWLHAPASEGARC
jgi:imidazole glycerol phosphate synthase glutamine amidotransferase subunit